MRTSTAGTVVHTIIGDHTFAIVHILPLLPYCKRAIIFGRTATIQFFTQKCNMVAVYDCNIGRIEYAGKMLGHEDDAGGLFILHHIQLT